MACIFIEKSSVSKYDYSATVLSRAGRIDSGKVGENVSIHLKPVAAAILQVLRKVSAWSG